MLPIVFLPKKTVAVSATSAKHSFLRAMLLWTAFLATTAAYAQQPFITTWKTDNPGASNSTSVRISTLGGGYNYEVDWNDDGVYDQTGITGTVTHDYGVAGIYTIRLRGAFPRMGFNAAGDRQKLINIAQWGDIAWTTMADAFWACPNLQISATDVPNLSGVTNMSQMFRACTVLNGPANIGSWNTANVTSMSDMFYLAVAFNQPLNNWNTSNVNYMSGMFRDAHAFNQPLHNWNTANVLSMAYMFWDAHAFNQPIGNWNTANVTSMNGTFWNAYAFDQPIGNWDITSVTTMAGMFEGTLAFNQPLANWNTANVGNMGSMFYQAAAFNQPIGNWNTANVGTMNNMFQQAAAFNQPIGNWNTANVVNMLNMFDQAAAFNQSLGNWTLRTNALLSNMLDNSGMDCDHYSATLVGWSNNPVTPNGRSLGAVGLQYGTSAVAARTNLDITKTWTITGDAASGAACAALLPVTLLSFTGKQQTNGVLLEWQTASEQNNAGFHIERSEDGLRWMDIGFVAGKGWTTERQDYVFLDEKLMTGRSYYRLRQTDFNSQTELSKVVSIDLKNIGTVRVFPNPVTNGELTLFLSDNTEEEMIVQLFSPLGQLLRSMTISNISNSLDVKDLPTGVYTLQIVRGQESVVKKIVVQH